MWESKKHEKQENIYGSSFIDSMIHIIPMYKRQEQQY